ncbi:MAG: choice-of-anchor J domain-containing protein, partial [Muribaculaceae bacterium]|nr:choice-of-anchor J domain-containing protein [Muribaculaceae bacterium]
DPSQSGFETWKQSSQYGLVATGGKTPGAVVTDAMAISPVIDLSDYTQIRMMVHQAGNYFNNSANFAEMTATMVREEGSDEWKQLEVPYPPAGNSWTFSNSGYMVLDEYAGKKVEIGFRYTSTSSLSGTWEIDKVTLAGVYSK